VLAAGAAGAVFNFYHATQISQEIDLRSRREGELQAQYQEVVNSMRAQRSATDTVRDTATFFNSQIRPAPAAPGKLLNEISGVLDGFPSVKLNQILWATNNDATFMPTTPQGFGASNANLAGIAQVTSENKTTQAATIAANAVSAVTAAATPENLLNPPLTGNKYHVALIDAAINPFDGDFRKALAEIDRLVVAFKQNPELTVKVIKLPVDDTPAANLKVIDKSGATATQAPFTLHVAQKVPGT
jgi:hypothetical protein